MKYIRVPGMKERGAVEIRMRETGYDDPWMSPYYGDPCPDDQYWWWRKHPDAPWPGVYWVEIDGERFLICTERTMNKPRREFPRITLPCYPGGADECFAVATEAAQAGHQVRTLRQNPCSGEFTEVVLQERRSGEVTEVLERRFGHRG